MGGNLWTLLEGNQHNTTGGQTDIGTTVCLEEYSARNNFVSHSALIFYF